MKKHNLFVNAIKQVVPNSVQRSVKARWKKFWHSHRETLYKNVPSLVNKERGYSQYTIVSACYNVEKYIDEYVLSLVNQTLNFENNIYLVLVNDGSTDNTLQKLKSWREKYPNNITIVDKPNGGVSSARNAGLQFVKTPWVTFCDPDDFLNKSAFLKLDNAIKNGGDSVCLAVMKMINYFEATNDFKGHYLDYRFTRKQPIKVLDSNNFVNFYVTATLLRTDSILSNRIVFREEIKPNFEDAFFINEYLSYHLDDFMVFEGGAHYFYRKRADNSSLINTKRKKIEFYTNYLDDGIIALCELYKNKFGLVPKFIQNLVLMDLYWSIIETVNHPGVVPDFVNKEQYISRFQRAFTFIDEQTVMDCSRWLYWKIGALWCFKKIKPSWNFLYVDRYDSVNDELVCYYFSGESARDCFYLNGKEIIPSIRKTARSDFLSCTFVNTHWLRLPLNGKEGYLSARLGNQITSIKCNGQTKQLYDISALRNMMLFKQQTVSGNSKFKGCWLLMDRDTQADDNAEHLYRWMKQNNVPENVYFVLRDDSHDWLRLKNEGFKLISFGSKDHEDALCCCSRIISSHCEKYIYDYFKDGSLLSKKYVFLQHGVTKDDLSGWLNGVPKIDLLITASRRETESFIAENSRYKFFSCDVKLTGFPRHDALLNKPSKKQILIMPTWRRWLVGNNLGVGHDRSINLATQTSEYIERWSSFIKSKKLKNLSMQFGYKIVLFPHYEMVPYLESMEVPEYIEVCTNTSSLIQKLFVDSSLMITDYSSVAFEMAYLKKGIIYYQFDREQFFNKHLEKGYFDYDNDGFGEVAFDENSLLSSIEKLLSNECKPAPHFVERMNETFAFRDGKCCERVYEAIKALDEPRH